MLKFYAGTPPQGPYDHLPDYVKALVTRAEYESDLALRKAKIEAAGKSQSPSSLKKNSQP
jgi:hypothetical protein